MEHTSSVGGTEIVLAPEWIYFYESAIFKEIPCLKPSGTANDDGSLVFVDAADADIDHIHTNSEDGHPCSCEKIHKSGEQYFLCSVQHCNFDQLPNALIAKFKVQCEYLL